MDLNYTRRFSAYVSTFYHSECITLSCVGIFSPVILDKVIKWMKDELRTVMNN